MKSNTYELNMKDMNKREQNMDELNVANGGSFLDTITSPITWTYRNIIKPVGEYVVNTVKEVVELPLKPLKDKLDELQPNKPVKPIDKTLYIVQADC